MYQDYERFSLFFVILLCNLQIFFVCNTFIEKKRKHHGEEGTCCRHLGLWRPVVQGPRAWEWAGQADGSGFWSGDTRRKKVWMGKWLRSWANFWFKQNLQVDLLCLCLVAWRCPRGCFPSMVRSERLLNPNQIQPIFIEPLSRARCCRVPGMQFTRQTRSLLSRLMY